MDVDALRLGGALLGALFVAALGVGVALRGGPRRRPGMTPGVTGGRVRLPARALERVALTAAAVLLALLLLAAPTPSMAVAAIFATSCLAFAVRRGAFLALAARELGPDDHVDDGYVDATQGQRHD